MVADTTGSAAAPEEEPGGDQAAAAAAAAASPERAEGLGFWAKASPAAASASPDSAHDDGGGAEAKAAPASLDGVGKEGAELTGSDDENVGMLERSLRALTSRAVLGVPGMPSQRPCSALAQELLEEEKDVEQAVEKCGDLGGRQWSDATARFVFGFVPFIGGMGVQLEEMWLQIRCVAIIASLYGHDVEQEDVQQRIILCLMDGAATQVADGSAKLQMERVALQQVLRKLALSMSGAGQLEGLFNGVTGTLRGAWSGGRPPPALIDRCRTHFKPQSALQQPATSTTMIAVMAVALVVCKLVTPVAKLIELPDKIVKPKRRLEEMPWLRPLVSIAALLVAIALLVFAAKKIVARVNRTVSTIPLLVFLGLAALQAILAMTATEDLLSVFHWLSEGENILRVLYHAHRGAYGVIGLVIHAEDIRTGKIPTEWKQLKTGLQYSLLYWPWHAILIGTGVIATHMIVVDIVALLCQNLLMDTLKKFEVLTAVMSRVFGTSEMMNTLQNLIFRAGGAVANPKIILGYLDDVTPTKQECCFVVTLRDVAMYIGVAHAPIQMLATAKDLLSNSQKGLLISTELCAIGMALAMRMHVTMAEHEDELSGRCRLFALIPADANTKDKMKRAVDWIAKYEGTITPIRNVTSSISQATSDTFSRVTQSVSSVAQSVGGSETVAGVYNSVGSLHSSLSHRALEAEKARMEAIMQAALNEEAGGGEQADGGGGVASRDDGARSPGGSSHQAGWGSLASFATRATGGRIVDDDDEDDDWGESPAPTPRDENDEDADEPSDEAAVRNGPAVNTAATFVPEVDEEGNFHTVVQRGAQFEVEIAVSSEQISSEEAEELGLAVQWSFEMDAAVGATPQASTVDIGFEVLHSVESGSGEGDDGEQGQSSPGKPSLNRMYPYQRYPLNATMRTTGSLPALVAGTYIARWDNSYSWTTSKKIKYRLWVGTPAEPEPEPETDPEPEQAVESDEQAELEKSAEGAEASAQDGPVSPSQERPVAEVREKEEDGEESIGEHKEVSVGPAAVSVSPASAWLSGIVPGGAYDATTAVVNAANWAKNKDLDAQKVAMQRKIEQALADEARKQDEAAEEAAVQALKELEALGPDTGTDDVATRILRKRAVRRVAGAHTQRVTTDDGAVVSSSSALRTSSLVMPQATPTVAAPVPVAQPEPEPELEPDTVEQDRLASAQVAAEEKEEEAARAAAAESERARVAVRDATERAHAEAKAEATRLAAEQAAQAAAEVTARAAAEAKEASKALAAAVSTAEDSLDDFGDAPDFSDEDDGFDAIDEARLSPATSPVEKVDTVPQPTLAVSSPLGCTTTVVPIANTAAVGGMDAEMIRRSKLTRKFTQLREEVAATPGSPTPTQEESLDMSVECHLTPEVRPLDIEPSASDAPQSPDNKSGQSPKSPSLLDSPLAAKMRWLAAEMAAEAEAEEEDDDADDADFAAFGQRCQAQPQAQPATDEGAGANAKPDAGTEKEAVGGPEEDPAATSPAPAAAGSWLGNWMPGGAHDVTSAVVNAASWAQQSQLDAQKVDMERKIEEALAEEKLQKARLADEEEAARAQQLAALGVVADTGGGEGDDMATRILKKRAAARARAALASGKQD